MDTYDVIVLGAGPTGENVADRAVRGGLSAALVEVELVGGECSYWACMPSKALLRGPEVLAAARAVDGAAQAVTGELDVQATLRRRDRFTSGWNDSGQVEWATSHGIDVIRGHGRLAGPRTVTVADRRLTARHAVVVATGSEAAYPPVPGLAAASPWTNREATEAKQAPARLGVLGGGPVGAELAGAWAALGSRVTLFELADRLLPGQEPFAGELVAEALRDAGVDVRVGTNVSEVSRDGDGPTSIHVDGSTVDVDAFLVASGRRARTADIGLDTVGVKAGGWLEVDDTCRVTAVGEGWLYAVGDVNGRRLLTHMGKYQARACGDVIVARSRGEEPDAATPWTPWTATADHDAAPGVVFTDPQVASVGLTEQMARDRGLDVRAVEYEIGNVAGANLRADGYKGRAKLVVDESRRVAVGVTFVGPDVGEMLHAATVAVVGEVPLDRLWHAVPAYPTASEIWLRLLETYGM